MKRTPLKRKQSMRDAYADKVRAAAHEGARKIVKRKFARHKGLKKISRSHRNRLAEYFVVRDEFLREHPDCQICERRREHGENIRLNPSSEVHHMRSRIGSLLSDVRGFAASCRACREWPHIHASLARELGLLAPPALWGVPFDR